MKPTAIVFGAGAAGRRTQQYYANSFRIVAFVDNDPRKVGTSVCGLPIRDPADLKAMAFDGVLVGSTYAGEITRQLLAMGVSHAKIGWVEPDILHGRFDSLGTFRRVTVAAAVIGFLLVATLAAAVVWLW